MGETVTPQLVMKKANGKYLSFLKAWLRGEDIFPLSLRGCSINLTVPHSQRMELIRALGEKQKKEDSPGFNLVLDTRESRKEGRQTLLKTIEFSTCHDYVSFIGKKKEFARFREQTGRIRQSLPELEEWICDNPKKILKNLDEWEALIEVALFFRNEEPHSLSLRNLPITVPTKFIETHQAVLRGILDQVIPEERISRSETDLALRYGLAKDDDFRFRVILPEPLSEEIPLRDIAVLPVELAEWNPPVTHVLVIENKHSFLSLDLPPNWLKIWGMGKSVVRLDTCKWLESKKLYYWGDMDPQGYEILHSLRVLFPHTRSICMGMEDYNHFKPYAHDAGIFYEKEDLRLSLEEIECYRYLIINQTFSRIEQERIDKSWVKRALSLSIDQEP